MKLTEALDRYLKESGRLTTVESKRSFMKVMNHFRRHAGWNVRLDEITPDMLTAWCLKPQRNGKPVAPATIKKRRAHARSFFGWVTYRGWVATDPSAGLAYSVNAGRGGKRQHTWLNKAEAITVIRGMPDTPAGQRDTLVLMLGALCGLRATEICNLQWKDFNDDFSVVEVLGKGNKLERLGIPPELRPALKAWHDRRPAHASCVLPHMREVFKPGEGRVRIMDWSKPIKYDGLLYVVRKAGERVGVKLRPHDLRRTFAGILEESGVPIADIQRAMRHDNIGTTSRYLESNPARTVAATEGLTLGL